MPATIEVLSNDFEKLIKRLVANSADIARDNALAIEKRAKENVRVKTGSAQAAIYTLADGHDGYSDAVSEAQSRNAHVQIVPKADIPNGQEAVVAGAAAHNLVLEYGGLHTPAYPYLTPAAEAQKRPFEEAMTRVLDE